MNPWWRTSVTINRALCGNRGEPVCSRVYRQPPSIWRSAFMRATNILFRETSHCEDIHARWAGPHLTATPSQPQQLALDHVPDVRIALPSGREGGMDALS